MDEICAWARKSPLLRKYHDERWGRLITDDYEFFSLLILESFSTGLSWELILKKEETILKGTHSLNPYTLKDYTKEDEEILLHTPGFLPHKGKIASLKVNAIAYLTLLKEFGHFSSYLNHLCIVPVDHALKEGDSMPVQDDASLLLAKDMKKRGFRYVGPVILYSFLQASGYRNDHLLSCPFHG